MKQRILDGHELPSGEVPLAARSGGARLVVPVGERDHVLGPMLAPVTLVEFGDYQCRQCGQAYHIQNALERRMTKRLRIVYRHFPLSVSHARAEVAAEAAEAAGAQGKFWQMHALLFENQAQLDDAALLRYAAHLDLDLPRFRRELGERVHADRVREDFMIGIRSGVNGTPTFFINGLRHDGYQDFTTLLQALEASSPPAIDGRRRQILKSA
jgi:protein-disulfide isomerase